MPWFKHRADGELWYAEHAMVIWHKLMTGFSQARRLHWLVSFLISDIFSKGMWTMFNLMLCGCIPSAIWVTQWGLKRSYTVSETYENLMGSWYFFGSLGESWSLGLWFHKIVEHLVSITIYLTINSHIYLISYSESIIDFLFSESVA